MIGLFGNEIPDTEPDRNKMGWCQRWRSENCYHKAEDKAVSCKTCRFIYKSGGFKRVYYKCHIMGHSFSSHSDIRLKNVCNKWRRLEIPEVVMARSKET